MLRDQAGPVYWPTHAQAVTYADRRARLLQGNRYRVERHVCPRGRWLVRVTRQPAYSERVAEPCS